MKVKCLSCNDEYYHNYEKNVLDWVEEHCKKKHGGFKYISFVKPSKSNIGVNMKDWKCRNCGFQFIPTFWVQGSPGDMVGQCPNCGSNATNEAINTDCLVKSNKPQEKIRLDE